MTESFYMVKYGADSITSWQFVVLKTKKITQQAELKTD